jgi:hypothetical protein
MTTFQACEGINLKFLGPFEGPQVFLVKYYAAMISDLKSFRANAVFSSEIKLSLMQITHLQNPHLPAAIMQPRRGVGLRIGAIL